MQRKQSANLRIQKANRTSIYQLVRKEDGLTRQDILRRLNLSLPTVVRNIKTLEREGLVRENGFTGHTGGRRAATYRIVGDARTAIGLDISRNGIIAAAVDLTGRIVAEKRETFPFGLSDGYCRHLGAIVRGIVKSAALEEKNILGVGLGVPGLVTADNRTVFYGEILKFTGATCGDFSRYIPYPSAMFNDANAAGLAEFWIRGEPGNAFYVMLSNNVGGTVMINNLILEGAHLHSGEIGHLTLHPGGKTCYCGQKGCADPYLAATVLSDPWSGSLEEFFRQLEKGNRGAQKTWAVYLDDLALAANSLQALFDCKVIIGGYVAEYLEKYMGEVKKRTARLNTFEKDADYLEISRYKTNSIAAGAALYFISRFIDSI
jgi:predicted NBD/HSP70 family sugar kinase